MTHPLPGPEFWALVRPHTGGQVDTEPTARGFGSDLTAVVECEKGPFFIKAMRNRPGGRRDSITRERVISPFVTSVSPALKWHVEDEHWIALGFEVVDGWPADFAPGSPDVPAVVDLVDRIGKLHLPEVARDWPETRWHPFALDESEAELFRGDSLLHTDINPSNLLVGSRGMWAVDWAWPTRGAGFIDPALLVVQLVAAGHSPDAAESQVSGCSAWVKADREAVDAFSAALLRMYRVFSDRKPEVSWLKAMVTAARFWVDHRHVTVV